MECTADSTPIVRDKDENEDGARGRALSVASNSEGQHPEVVGAQEEDGEEDEENQINERRMATITELGCPSLSKTDSHGLLCVSHI